MNTRLRRHGLTLVEVLVALLVFATAALSSLAVHAMAARQSTQLAQREALAHLATNILDSLRASSCTNVASGSLTQPSGSLTWTATPSPSFVAIQLQVAPANGTPWYLNGVTPC